MAKYNSAYLPGVTTFYSGGLTIGTADAVIPLVGYHDPLGLFVGQTASGFTVPTNAPGLYVFDGYISFPDLAAGSPAPVGAMVGLYLKGATSGTLYTNATHWTAQGAMHGTARIREAIFLTGTPEPIQLWGRFDYPTGYTGQASAGMGSGHFSLEYRPNS